MILELTSMINSACNLPNLLYVWFCLLKDFTSMHMTYLILLLIWLHDHLFPYPFSYSSLVTCVSGILQGEQAIFAYSCRRPFSSVCMDFSVVICSSWPSDCCMEFWAIHYFPLLSRTFSRHYIFCSSI